MHYLLQEKKHKNLSLEWSKILILSCQTLHKTGIEMTVAPAKTLMEVKDVTKPTPLSGDELDAFYVFTDSVRDPLFPITSQLDDFLFYDASMPTKLLFASHPGTGKTTELNQLMVRLKDDFWFVEFSIGEELDTATITAIDLFIVLLMKLYQRGLEHDLIKDERVVESVWNWLNETVTEYIPRRVEPLGTHKGLLSQVISILSNIKEAFSYSYDSAEKLRQAIKPRLAELRNYCNIVINEITNNLSTRRLLIIVDDTDKLDVSVAHKLFVKQTALLSDIQAPIIYTVPLYLVFSPNFRRLESYFEVRTLSMIKTHTREGSPFKAGHEILRNIIFKRLNKNLIDLEALDLAIIYTGGILRDLLRVVQHASDIARLAGKERITNDEVRNSLDRLKSIYSLSVYGSMGISTDDLYSKLIEVDRASQGQIAFDEKLQLLLYTQAVIQYDRNWYRLHPLMKEILKEMGIL